MPVSYRWFWLDVNVENNVCLASICFFLRVPRLVSLGLCVLWKQDLEESRETKEIDDMFMTGEEKPRPWR